MTIVRAIMKEVRTHWICVTSARRCVIIVGTATFTEPIITEFVSEPRIIDRLMAQRAENIGPPGISTGLAAVEEAERGGLGTGCSFLPQLWGKAGITSAANRRMERNTCSCVSRLPAFIQQSRLLQPVSAWSQRILAITSCGVP